MTVKQIYILNKCLFAQSCCSLFTDLPNGLIQSLSRNVCLPVVECRTIACNFFPKVSFRQSDSLGMEYLNLETWKLGRLANWKIGNLENWKFGNVDT